MALLHQAGRSHRFEVVPAVLAACCIVAGAAGRRPSLALATPIVLGLLAVVLRSSRPATVAGPWPATSLRTAIDRELDRCRRHHRRCAVVVARSAAPRRRAVAAAIRRTDELWAAGDDLVLLLPETDRGGAEQAVRRAVGLGAEVHVVTCPDELGSTPELLDALDEPAWAA